MDTTLTARQIKKRAYMKEYNRKKRENPEYKKKEREYAKKQRENPEVREKQRECDRKRRLDPEKKKKMIENRKEYIQTPNWKKSNTKTNWKRSGMIFTEEEFQRIYNLYLSQELCNTCDCVLTRGERYTTPSKACMDHDHETGLFRHIICHSCNANDNWMKYFC